MKRLLPKEYEHLQDKVIRYDEAELDGKMVSRWAYVDDRGKERAIILPLEEEESRYEKLRRERRFMAVPVDINTFGEMLIHGTAKYTADGMPSDAIFVTADKDMQQQVFKFIYLHESFEPVEEGVVLPTTQVMLTRYEY